MANKYTVTQLFHWHIHNCPGQILKVKVKVMHISTMNILQIMTGSANISTGNKLKIAC